MEILFTKTAREDHVLSCKRKDGSVTWKHVSSFFIYHDLGHYAVETALPLKKAFFGMVKDGTNIHEFDLPKDKRNIELTKEAIFGEQLVNLLTIEYAQGKMVNFIEIFKAINDNAGNGDLMVLLTEEKLEKIRTAYKKLIEDWHVLSENDTLTLLFEE